MDATTKERSTAAKVAKEATRPNGHGTQTETTPAIWSDPPFNFMQRFADDMERLFGYFGLGVGRGPLGHMPGWFGRGPEFMRHGSGGVATPWMPRIEMVEEGSQFVVNAELPGLSKDDVKVDITSDTLTIHGERNQEQEEKREGYFHSEWHYGSFYRDIPLPEGVDRDKASVTFKNGVLRVALPLVAGARANRRRLEIREE